MLAVGRASGVALPSTPPRDAQHFGVLETCLRFGPQKACRRDRTCSARKDVSVDPLTGALHPQARIAPSKLIRPGLSAVSNQETECFPIPLAAATSLLESTTRPAFNASLFIHALTLGKHFASLVSFMLPRLFAERLASPNPALNSHKKRWPNKVSPT